MIGQKELATYQLSLVIRGIPQHFPVGEIINTEGLLAFNKTPGGAE